ncbi:hypothetical protein KCP70_22440 [Salmonella enterica subsp. enterica]|nr:hypothetical protein KCP70_22440 [Salmonella enterica subsp. enterica]
MRLSAGYQQYLHQPRLQRSIAAGSLLRRLQLATAALVSHSAYFCPRLTINAGLPRWSSILCAVGAAAFGLCFSPAVI